MVEVGKAADLAKALRKVLEEEVKALAEEICGLPDEKRDRGLALLEDISSALGLEA